METVCELIDACDRIQYQQTGEHFTQTKRVWSMVRCYCRYLAVCCIRLYIDTGDFIYIDALKLILSVFCIRYGHVRIDMKSDSAHEAMRLIMDSLYDDVPVERIAYAIINRPDELTSVERDISNRQRMEYYRRSRC